MKKLIFTWVMMLCLSATAMAENYPYRSDYLWVTVPDHSDWLYETGEKAVIDIQFLKYGIPRDGVVEYTIGNDMLEDDAKGEVTLKNGKAKVNMGTRKTPGFRDLRLKVKVDGKTYSHHIKVGFSVDKIKPFTKEPADFKAFWNNNIEEMRKTKLSYTKELAKEYCTDKMDCYLVKLIINRQKQAV